MPKRFRDGLAKHGETFHYRFWHRGTLYIGNTQCRSLDAAEEWLAGFRDQLALERVGGQRQITFGKLVAEWLEVHKNVHSASHLRGVSGASRSYLAPFLNLKLDQVTTERVEDIRAKYLRNHSPGGANDLLKILNLLFGFAVRRGLLRALPYRVKMLRVQRRPRVVLPASAVTAFFTEVDRARNPHVGIAIRLMIGLGLREAEALGARWEWINWSRCTYTPGQTKGREADPIPIPRWLMDRLKPLHASRENPVEGWVLPAPDGHPHRSQFTKKAVVRAGIQVGLSKLTPHRLRATFATLHSESGTPIQVIQHMLRHKEISTTMAYLEIPQDSMRLGQERVATAIGL